MKLCLPTQSSRLSAALSAATLSAWLPFGLVAQMPDSARITAGADRVISAAVLSPAASPGCAVGISRDGRSIYQRAFGLADLEFGIPLTPESISESGSVAKQFTAAAVVLLALEGKLNLDDPARKYLPELPDYGKPLSIRRREDTSHDATQDHITPSCATAAPRSCWSVNTPANRSPDVATRSAMAPIVRRVASSPAATSERPSVACTARSGTRTRCSWRRSRWRMSSKRKRATLP